VCRDTAMNVSFRNVIGSPWTEMEPVRVGPVPSGIPTPDVFVIAEENDKPVLRVDVYGVDHASAFKESIAWKHWIVIGIGHHLYLVPLTADNPSTLDLNGAFGSLYPLDHCLLVASDQRLFCVTTDGIVKWSSPELGIDDVVVSRVWDGIIDGEGEWDPPGGWKPFRITLDSGSPILQSR
jgi:hypothetical protein